MKSPAKQLLMLCGLIVALHVAGTIWPSHLAWGFHLFAFYPPAVGWAALVASLLLLIPRVLDSVGRGLDSAVRAASRFPGFVVTTGLAGALILLGLRFAVELHLLGDGAILIRSIPKATWGDDVISSFKNQPLLNVIYRWAMNVDPSGPNTHPLEVYSTINFIAGTVLVFLTAWFVRSLPRPPVERFLAGLFLFAAAGTQFFFGYVENYVLQYVATIAYAATGWLALERRVHVAVPLLILTVLPGLNLGTLILLPSGLFLILARYPERRLLSLGVLGALGVAGVVGLIIVGFDFAGFFGKFTGRTVDFLPVLQSVDGNYPYAMFSWAHLVDWFNAHTLIVPFGVFTAGVLLRSLPREERWKSPALWFLMVLSGCGLLFTWIVNSALGMARDWDMLSSYFIPLAVLDVYLLTRAPDLEPRRPVMVAMTLLGLLHLAAFIGINADAGRHLRRVRTLDDPRLLSRASQMWFDEALANLYFDSGRYADAKIYYEHYMTIDSMNTRIIGNISDVYRKLGESEKYFVQLQRGVKLGSPNPGMYSNLGVEFSSRGDTAMAIYWNLKAVELDSLQQSGNANLGLLFMGRKDYAKSNYYFGRAIEAGMREPKVFLYAAESAVLSKQYLRAVELYERYLEDVPDDRKARQQLDRLRSFLRENGTAP